MAKAKKKPVHPNLDDFKKELAEFCWKYPRPSLVMPLKLSALYSLEDSYDGTYPNCGYAGVYIFLDRDKNLLYIGKTSNTSTFDDRLGTYFRYKEGGVGGTVQNGKEKFEGVRYLATIPLDDTNAFEAGAIEEYLIGKLKPPLNHVGTL